MRKLISRIPFHRVITLLVEELEQPVEAAPERVAAEELGQEPVAFAAVVVLAVVAAVAFVASVVAAFAVEEPFAP